MKCFYLKMTKNLSRVTTVDFAREKLLLIKAIQITENDIDTVEAENDVELYYKALSQTQTYKVVF